MNKLKSAFLRIWTSPVGAEVSSAIIVAGISFLTQKIFKLTGFFKTFLEIKLSIGISISVVLGLVAVIIVFFVRIKKERMKFEKEKFEFQNINDKQKKEIEELRKRISLLEKLPENPKLKEFQQGEIVIRNLDKEKLGPKEYSVIGIDLEKQEVIVRDEKGETHSFLPDELLSKTEADKILKETLNQFYKNSGNTNRW